MRFDFAQAEYRLAMNSKPLEMETIAWYLCGFEFVQWLEWSCRATNSIPKWTERRRRHRHISLQRPWPETMLEMRISCLRAALQLLFGAVG
jgi:hypothetical protein